MIHMPNNYSDEDWNDLTAEERAQSLRWARQAAYMDDEERADVEAQIAKLYEDLDGETDHDAYMDVMREINDLEEMLRAEPDDDDHE